MSKAVVDPGELRRFAHDLKRFNNGLREQMTALMGRMNELGETWRDQEHVKFAADFEQTMRALAKFTDTTDKHVPFLVRKAEKIEAYLNQK